MARDECCDEDGTQVPHPICNVHGRQQHARVHFIARTDRQHGPSAFAKTNAHLTHNSFYEIIRRTPTNIAGPQRIYSSSQEDNFNNLKGRIVWHDPL
jgi:hypothetical protein